jgi:hypothetical protein
VPESWLLSLKTLYAAGKMPDFFSASTRCSQSLTVFQLRIVWDAKYFQTLARSGVQNVG